MEDPKHDLYDTAPVQLPGTPEETMRLSMAAARARSGLRGRPGMAATRRAAVSLERGDRADQALVFYLAVLLDGSFAEECLENRTLRDEPEVLRDAMRGLLCDVRHLADAADITWEQILAEANQSYREELGDGKQ